MVTTRSSRLAAQGSQEIQPQRGVSERQRRPRFSEKESSERENPLGVQKPIRNAQAEVEQRDIESKSAASEGAESGKKTAKNISSEEIRQRYPMGVDQSRTVAKAGVTDAKEPHERAAETGDEGSKSRQPVLELREVIPHDAMAKKRDAHVSDDLRASPKGQDPKSTVRNSVRIEDELVLLAESMGHSEVKEQSKINLPSRDLGLSRLFRKVIRQGFDEQSAAESGSDADKQLPATSKREGRLFRLGPLLSFQIGNHFDCAQLWEELELRNKPLLSDLRGKIRRVQHSLSESAKLRSHLRASQEAGETPATEKKLDSHGNTVDHPPLGEEREPGRDEGQNMARELQAGASEGNQTAKHVRFTIDANDIRENVNISKQVSQSPIDDGFFALDDMEMFADDAEKLARQGKLMNFDDGDSSDESSMEIEEGNDHRLATSQQRSSNVRYGDFFDPPADPSFQREGERSEEANVHGVEFENENIHLKTPLAESRARRQKRINAIEEQNISRKPWQLRGEVSSSARPRDSLLETALEHDSASRGPLNDSSVTNNTIEDIIRQRITDGLFDDVQPSVPEGYGERSVTKPAADSTLGEQPSQTLAEVYEQDFLAEKDRIRQRSLPEVTSSAIQDLTLEQKEVNRMFEKLAAKLDALSRLHFTPSTKENGSDMVVDRSLKALQSEEPIPDTLSNAKVLAPKEVYSVDKGSRVPESEASKQERKAARQRSKARKKKSTQARLRASQIVAQRSPSAVEKRQAQLSAERKAKRARHERQEL